MLSADKFTSPEKIEKGSVTQSPKAEPAPGSTTSPPLDLSEAPQFDQSNARFFKFRECDEPVAVTELFDQDLTTTTG